MDQSRNVSQGSHKQTNKQMLTGDTCWNNYNYHVFEALHTSQLMGGTQGSYKFGEVIVTQHF
jgi:hypothetical protein